MVSGSRIQLLILSEEEYIEKNQNTFIDEKKFAENNIVRNNVIKILKNI